MPFITEQEAINNVNGFDALSSGDKARYLSQSEAYLIARNVKPYDDVELVPQPLKLASFELIKGIIAGKLYQGKAQVVQSKTVSATSGTSVSKTFVSGSEDINEYEQYVLDLIKPYTKRSNLQMLKRM